MLFQTPNQQCQSTEDKHCALCKMRPIVTDVPWFNMCLSVGHSRSCVTLVKGNPLSNYSWWIYTVLVFMVLFYGTWTILQLMLSVPHGESVYGGFGVFHIVHIAAYYLLWAVTYHCWMSCVAELLNRLRCLLGFELGWAQGTTHYIFMPRHLPCLLLHMSHFLWSLCVFVLGLTYEPCKTAYRLI